MNICMISDSFLPVIGGLQYELKYLIEALARENINVTLLSYSQGGEEYIDKKYSNISYIRLKKRRYSILELASIIWQISPDIIHLHTTSRIAFFISMLKSLLLMNQPIIVTSHGIDIMTQSDIGYGYRLNPLYNKLIKFVLRKADRHVIVGKSMLPYAREAGSKKDKLVLINNGIPLNYLAIDANKLDEIYSKYGIEHDDQIFLSFSGLRPLKGIEYLIKALSTIKNSIPKAKLLLACEANSEYARNMRRLVDELKLNDRVKFIGFVNNEEEKRALCRRCNIFCKPSLLEACSIAILEAMREGACVVATVPGGIDIITDNIDGILVREKDAEDFAQKSIEILQDHNKYALIKVNAKASISNFNIDRIAKKYIEIYKQII
jgi:glycosyltransferase involved in cell wall biosynthesis